MQGADPCLPYMMFSEDKLMTRAAKGDGPVKLWKRSAEAAARDGQPNKIMYKARDDSSERMPGYEPL